MSVVRQSRRRTAAVLAAAVLAFEMAAGFDRGDDLGLLALLLGLDGMQGKSDVPAEFLEQGLFLIVVRHVRPVGSPAR